MTTTVHAYSSYIHHAKKLQIVRRFPATGDETVLSDITAGNTVHTHHVWDDCELVFREVSVEAVATPNDAPVIAVEHEGVIHD